jgi:hypothetical protein
VHPTVDAQLDGIARLVEQAAGRLLEQLDDAPTADRLRTAAGTLRRLAAGWSMILPYLTWDNQATLVLLESLGRGDRARHVASAPLDPLDAAAVHARNLELRALLAEAVRALPAPDGSGPASAARAAVAAHVRERIARDPSGGRPRRSP